MRRDINTITAILCASILGFSAAETPSAPIPENGTQAPGFGAPPDGGAPPEFGKSPEFGPPPSGGGFMGPLREDATRR